MTTSTTNESWLTAIILFLAVLVAHAGVELRKVVVSWNKDGYYKHIEFQDANGSVIKSLNTANSYQITTSIQSTTVTNFCYVNNYDLSGNRSQSVVKQFILQ